MVLEAVQANAKVEGAEMLSTISSTGIMNLDTDIQNTLSDTASAEVSALPTEVTSLDLSVIKKSEAEYAIASDLQEQLSFDVTFTDQNGDAVTTFDQPVTIQLKIGSDLNNVRVYHKGVLIPSEYNSAEGIVTFSSSSFSEYAAVYDLPEVTVGSEVLTLSDVSGVYEDSSHNLYKVNKVDNEYTKRALVQTHNFFDEYDEIYEIQNLAQLKNIKTFLDENPSITNPIFKLVDDINISGLESPIDVAFRGTLDGQGHTIYGTENYITISGEDGVAIFKNFDNSTSVTMRNITLDKITVYASGEFAGLLIGGTNSHTENPNENCVLLFENINVTDKCSVTAVNSKAASLLGKGYGVYSLSVINCTSYASILTYGNNAAGFIGTVSSDPKTLVFKNNTFGGRVSANDFASSLCGQYNEVAADIESLKYENNVFSGQITATAAGASSSGFFAAHGSFPYGSATFTNNRVVSGAKFNLNPGSSTLDASYASSHIIAYAGVNFVDGVWSDYIKQTDQIGSLKVDVQNGNSFKLDAYSGAASYQVILVIDGKELSIDGSAADIISTKGIKISAQYNSVAELQNAFGRIQRVGYVTNSSVTSFTSSIDPAYAMYNNMNFLRVSADGDSATAVNNVFNTPVKVGGEWCLIINQENAAISPVGANFTYTFQALNAGGEVIAETIFIDYKGSSMIPHNMANMEFNFGQDYTSPYHEYGGTYYAE